MCVFQKSKEEMLSEEVAKNGLSGHTSSTNTGTNNGEGGAQHGRPLTVNDLKFSAKLGDLKDLMQKKGHEAIEKLDSDHGGLESLSRKLNTSLTNGISENPTEIAKRISVYGRNEIPPKKPKSIFMLAFEAVQDTTLVMLIICSIISIGLSFYHPSDEDVVQDEEYRRMEATAAKGPQTNLEWVEGCAILIAVVVVVFVTAFNDWRKEKQFRGLKDRIDAEHLASVIREGVVKQVNVKDLVVGDICLIKYGDLVPADGIVVHASDLKIDESSLTGESDLIRKTSSENVTILSGTHVMEGSGNFLVLAVGVHSQSGIIMTLLGATEMDEVEDEDVKKKASKSKDYLDQAANGDANKIVPDEDQSEDEDTKKKKPQSSKKHRSVLQIKLGKLALQIGYCGMISAMFTFLILIVRMSIEEFLVHKHPWSNVYIKYIISYLIQAITVIVVAVPEGLPLAVTLALAFAVRKMTKDNNLVRHLDACETMGNATTICSDKTGTLTTNRMTAVQCWISGTTYRTIPRGDQLSDKVKQLLFQSISINSNYASTIEKTTQLGELPKQIGNKTECGLLGLVTDLGGDFNLIRSNYPAEKFVKCYTFNSSRKMMSTVIRSGAGYRVHSKGASEIVLGKCSFYLNADGLPVPMSGEDCRQLVHTVVEQMASEGLRTICVAYRDFQPADGRPHGMNESVAYFDQEPDWDNEAEIVTKLTCVCLVGIEDPVRAEVPDAIRKCQKSGVVVRMVTGDNVNTATSIAIKCGIIRPQDDFLILESKDFNKRIRDASGEVKQELLDQVWPRLRVLARSSPQDKYILVNGIVESKLKSNREVVAVTGDGTNDGPALKRADVGFAMGIQGTDVAKEASDIILTDDNFSSIVKAMMWGRNVYDAIAKFLQFQLTANFVAGIFSVVCAATIQSVPLKAVQMLWVNLVMDTLASLALATEPPTEDLLERKPYGRDKSILSFTMIRNIIFHAVYQLIVLFFLVWYIEDWMLVESVLATYDVTKLKEPSLHFTIIFNAFVLMTLFNEINARKIHNERNVFAGIQNNKVFLLIWLGCFFGQILIVNFGGIIFGVERIGLDHWMWCLCLGFGSLIWGQVVTSIPVSWLKNIYQRVACKQKPVKVKKHPEEQFQEDLDLDQEAIDRSKVLWIRGANRIQNQIRVVEAFRASSGDVLETCSAYGSMASLKAPRTKQI